MVLKRKFVLGAMSYSGVMHITGGFVEQDGSTVATDQHLLWDVEGGERSFHVAPRMPFAVGAHA